jgi:hypothetical protein
MAESEPVVAREEEGKEMIKEDWSLVSFKVNYVNAQKRKKN